MFARDDGGRRHRENEKNEIGKEEEKYQEQETGETCS